MKKPTLSIACVTTADSVVLPFLDRFRAIASDLGAQFIVGAHGIAACDYANSGKDIDGVLVEGSYFEELIDPVIRQCSGDYILRVDDDESLSEGLIEWLLSGEWYARDSWFFSRRHLWPDTGSCISMQPYFPDFQARLSVKRQARRPVKIHAAHAYPAYRAPGTAFFNHHVFLIRTREERKSTTAKYETIRTGKQFTPADVNVVLPWDAPNLVTLPVDSPQLIEIAEETVWWRQVGQRLPANLDQELREWRESISK